jgi:hypothetical protein
VKYFNMNLPHTKKSAASLVRKFVGRDGAESARIWFNVTVTAGP